MSAEEVCFIMWQLLHALKFLHANNVWHRWAAHHPPFSTITLYTKLVRRCSLASL